VTELLLFLLLTPCVVFYYNRGVFHHYNFLSNGSGLRPKPNQIPDKNTRPDMDKILEAVPEEAVFTNHDESELIQFSLIETNINPSL